ncbi:hypothetical protein C5167_019389 [Papaver somniferum]|uniref:Uncharacterized protein n=1 Tax=Papaver somniferum TaxID=3469 RepID=A0A4Y7ITD5_PAPSO|nr:hypothetical protein C5167_019389 [Papaver somniferum]
MQYHIYEVPQLIQGCNTNEMYVDRGDRSYCILFVTISKVNQVEGKVKNLLTATCMVNSITTTNENPNRTPSQPKELIELNTESDFKALITPDDNGYLSICGFGSLLSERSSRSTFPDLINFRIAKLIGFRRVFAHTAPIFFERGIANPQIQEISSLSVEPCEGETLVVTVFEIKESEVVPQTLEGTLFHRPAVLCGRYSDKEYFEFRCKAKNLGDIAYNNFLDHTFLGNRRTTIREYLASEGGSTIMEEEPPELLKTRYGG